MTAGWSSLVRNAAQGDVFHIIDTETTGASPPGSRVIELACLSLAHGEVVGRFDTLVDCGTPVPPFITGLTGIRTAMLAGQPSSGEAARAFAAYVDALPGHFVAHNAGFDYRFVGYEFEQAGLPWPFSGRYCTVRMGRAAVPGLARYNLDSLIRHFGIQVAGTRHRAMADVEATAEAFWRMARLLPGGEELAPGRYGPGRVLAADEGPPAWPVPTAAGAAPAARPTSTSGLAPAARPASASGLAPAARPASASGPTPAPTARPAPAIPGLAADAWPALLAAAKRRSPTLGALLAQHGQPAGVAPDGVLLVALPSAFHARFDAAKRAALADAAAEALGTGAALAPA